MVRTVARCPLAEPLLVRDAMVQQAGALRDEAFTRAQSAAWARRRAGWVSRVLGA